MLAVSSEGLRGVAMVSDEEEESSSSVVASDGGGVVGEATGERSTEGVRIRRLACRMIASEARRDLIPPCLLVTDGEDCGWGDGTGDSGGVGIFEGEIEERRRRLIREVPSPLFVVLFLPIEKNL